MSIRNELSYKIILDPDPEGGSYVVHCPALPGCYSQGDSREEAIQNITEAYQPVSKPAFWPASFSGGASGEQAVNSTVAPG